MSSFITCYNTIWLCKPQRSYPELDSFTTAGNVFKDERKAQGGCERDREGFFVISLYYLYWNGSIIYHSFVCNYNKSILYNFIFSCDLSWKLPINWLWVWPCSAARAVVPLFCLDCDGLRGAHSLAQLAGDAALFARRVPAQRVLASEPRRQRALLERVVDRSRLFEDVTQSHCETWNRRNSLR